MSCLIEWQQPENESVAPTRPRVIDQSCALRDSRCSAHFWLKLSSFRRAQLNTNKPAGWPASFRSVRKERRARLAAEPLCARARRYVHWAPK